MKTVHLISGGDAGGARTHVLRLLGELNKTGQAQLLCLGGGVLADDVRERGIPCETLTGGFFAQLCAAKQYIRSGGFNLVRCHGSRANLTAALLRPSLGVPVVSTIHSDHRLDYLHRPAARLVYGTLNALALRKMDALVCVSGAMREKYAARNFRRGRLFSVYNGADMDAPRSKMRREDFLAAHGIPAVPGDILTGTAARFDAVKDLSTMLRGFAAAAKEEPQLRLILAGAGAEEEMLRALAKELGVSDRVHFTGWLDDTDALYASLDICLLTSLSETFPYALTDAAKYRVPVIATAVGGVPELVENGVHGLLIAPGDTAALASDILTLSRDPALREKLGTALRDRTAKEFSLSAMALREKEICRAVLSPRREIVIAGAYGCGNRGDELMLENLLRDGRAAAPECAVTVLSHRPKETARRFDVDSLYYLNVPAIRRRMKSARALVFGGGNLLQDATSRRSLVYYLALLRKGKQSGCRTLLHGAGLGPLSPRGQMHGGAERMRRYARLSGEGKPCRGKEARHKRSGAHSRRGRRGRNIRDRRAAGERPSCLPPAGPRRAAVSGGICPRRRGDRRKARLEAAVYRHERPAGSAALPRAGLGDRRGGRRRAGGYSGAHAPFRLGTAHGIDAAARAHTLVSCRNTGVRHRR